MRERVLRTAGRCRRYRRDTESNSSPATPLPDRGTHPQEARTPTPTAPGSAAVSWRPGRTAQR